jgi:hypothetical protein
MLPWKCWQYGATQDTKHSLFTLFKHWQLWQTLDIPFKHTSGLPCHPSSSLKNVIWTWNEDSVKGDKYSALKSLLGIYCSLLYCHEHYLFLYNFIVLTDIKWHNKNNLLLLVHSIHTTFQLPISGTEQLKLGTDFNGRISCILQSQLRANKWRFHWFYNVIVLMVIKWHNKNNLLLRVHSIHTAFQLPISGTEQLKLATDFNGRISCIL